MPISEIVAPCLSIGPKPSLIIEVSIMAFVLNIIKMRNIYSKGGFWNTNPKFCRNLNRNWTDPDYRLNNFGFRLKYS